MIDDAELIERADVVVKLVSLPPNIQTVLLARGLDPFSLGETIEAIAAVGIPLDANEAIDFIFRARPEPPPFPSGRFGDGTYAVFYSALETETCLEEVRHHQGPSLALSSFPRYFTVLTCQFSGQSMMLRGLEAKYPDLISLTDAGYPFCRAAAAWAKTQGADALHTTSARRNDGTCVPVFIRERLDKAATAERYRFIFKGGLVEYEQPPP